MLHILAMTIALLGQPAEARTAVYRSEGRIIVVDWSRRVTGAMHSGVTPAMMVQTFDGEPSNTSVWKNRLSCGVTTPFAQLAIPSKAGRTVRTRRFSFEETPGPAAGRHFTVYGAARQKLMTYDYEPGVGVKTVDVLNVETGAVTQHYALESGEAFLSHCQW